MIPPPDLLLVQDVLSGQFWNLEFAASQLLSKIPTNPKAEQSSNFMLCPLLGDPQINGGLGYSFGQPGKDIGPFQRLAEYLLYRGIGWILPTTITDTLDHLATAFTQMEDFRREDSFLRAFCPGYHLEGPWISPEDGFRGAHPKACVIPPVWQDFERLQKAANGNIRLVTLAPESQGAFPMIQKLVKSGVKVAIGHTKAAGSLIREAADAGATLSTHLGNGISQIIPRHANPLWGQMAEGRLMPSIIPDGHHLPVDFIQTVIAAKGLSRVIVTADSSPLAGLPFGTYTLWDTEVEVTKEGKVGIPGSGLLAGSSSFTDDCLRWLVLNLPLPLKEALPLCGFHTAKALNISPPGANCQQSFALIKRDSPIPFDVVGVVYDGKLIK